VEARPARVLALRALAEAGEKAKGAQVLALLGSEALQDPAVAEAAKKLGLLPGNMAKAASVPSTAPRKGFDLGKLNAMRVDIAAVTPAESLDAAAFPLRVEFQDPRQTVKVRSPDGKKLVWRALEEKRGYYLFISDADGGNAKRLDACKNGYQPVWSPDSKRILYSAMDWKTEERNLFIYDLDAKTAKRAFNASQKVGPLASWSPDGSKIVFTYFDELWITNASGIGRSMLNLSRRTQAAVGDARLFAWSADGARLAYAARDGGPIYLIDLTSKI
jgi:dipeptidyl aminopeptidase/acylaminoacyl peptidase